ncbi:PAS domain-containing sensor histidine kinase [Desulfopila sp. IMCC35008]|uniref:hybrid sensor histidine kinase/response regulator n=1 Tax=Desulfopila sp. IMCC35008 TaxID=2653858 RepID=UPI0013D3E78E|nr:PAS domain-containing sensor histidine kinase [Desulfopila sp. IMCC35008]
MAGIESVLKPEENNIELIVEYMDTKAMSYGSEYKQVLYELYKYKYHDQDFDLIVSSDDNAFNFLKEYHEELFPHAPVVFCGLNNSDAPKLLNPEQFTGVLETTAPKETIDLILQLHPETKKIILIIDKTPSGEYRWKMIEPILRHFEHIQFIRLSDDYSIAEIEDILGGLTQDTSVIFFTLYRDKSGKYFSVREGVSRVTRASTRPVYTTHLLELPYGVVGGKVLGGFHHGAFVAGIAKRILDGEKVSSIPFVKTSPTQFVFNYIALERWGLKLSDLPEGSVILNEPFSIYKEYKLFIWSIVSSIIILVAVILALQLNILRRKRAEKQLERSQQLLNKSQEISHVGSWHLDIKNNILTWSDEQYRIFGLKPQEFDASYDAFLDTIHPDDRDMVDRTYISAIENNLPYECIHRIIRHDGEVRVVLEKSEDVMDEHGVTIHSYGFTQDITELKAAEASLKENEAKFRNLLESTSTVPWELDLENSVFTYMGHQIEQILGYSAASWKDMNTWAERVHPEDREPTIQFCEIETKEGRDHDFIYRAIHKDGSYRWIRDVVSVVIESGKPKKLIGFMQDITDQKNLEQEQKQMEIKLQQAQKLEAIGTLAGGIAHDFNNILGVILGYTEMAREDSPSGSAIAKYLDMVLEASNRAKNLVQQILTFSRQEQSKFVLFEPAQIVEEAIRMLRPTFPSTINIQQDIARQTGSVFADPSQFNQILINLCTNAFHAMEKSGGQLDICLKEIYLESENLVNEPDLTPGNYVQLSVHDSGLGISKEVKDKIFDPFFTTKDPGKGTGMGLSIIHGIVNSFGGFITFDSELDKGSTFHVFIPVSDKEKISENDLEEQISKGKENILFIDDEQILGEMGKAMLERLGYNVTLRNSSLEALETFNNHHEQFDLVITDQTMPGMTGADLARRMIQIRPDIPVILCTGFSSIISEEEAALIGIKEFAYKPLTKRELSELIRKVLDQT